MTLTEEKLIEVGNTLALSIGHKPKCPRVSMAIPCVCGCAKLQAQALDDWKHLVAEIKEQ